MSPIEANTLQRLRRVPASTRDECTIKAWHAGREELLLENTRLKLALNALVDPKRKVN
jgi:hypothetical protein|tara:strand:- start:56 stop:229 length:174 start_codon:yes stop_codon:yes gene_type:complete